MLKKGELNGLCNRSACLKPGANWYNTCTYNFYCEECAVLINETNFAGIKDMCKPPSADDHNRFVNYVPEPETIDIPKFDRMRTDRAYRRASKNF